MNDEKLSVRSESVTGTDAATEEETSSSVSRDRSVDVTDGRLFKPLVLLSAPIVLSQALDIVYYLVDLYWIGHLGTDAVAAMSYSWPVIFLVISIGLGLTTAGTVLVAQNKGAGRITHANTVAGGTVSFVTTVSIALAITGYVLTPWLLALVGATPGTEPHTLAVRYTRVTFLGLVPMFWFFVFDSVSRGWGDTRTPLKLMGVSVFVNVLVDPFFIHGFSANPIFDRVGLYSVEATLYAWTGFAGAGVEGAAVATVLSRSIAAALGLSLLFSGRVGLKVTLETLRLGRSTLAEIVTIGVPTAVEMGFRASGIAILTAIIAIEGDAAVAAYGIAEYLAALLFLPALGLARGTETTVGQNLGADQVTRAKHAVYLSAGMVVVVFVLVVAVAYPFAESIVSVFLAGETSDGSAETIVEMGAAYVWIVGPAIIFLGVFQVTLAAFRGSGNTKLAMVLSVQELWLFRLPLSYAFLVWFEMGIVGVWYAIALSYVVSTAISAGWFRRGTWVTSPSL
ncbi:MATE family efflux transporter [Natronorubrum sp. FCH18a]|uniref:MATE family efflux transporter n=1 Tax=Natronorubrum sp. FCH18a TaxID=3447018 RepID=UPI003F5104A2